jgi:hypothetical protein
MFRGIRCHAQAARKPSWGKLNVETDIARAMSLIAAGSVASLE